MTQTVPLYKGHLVTPRNLVVVFDTGAPVTIPVENASYVRVKALITEGRFNELPAAVSKALLVEKTSKGHFTVVNGSIMIDGKVLPAALSNKLVDLVDAGKDTKRLEFFWDNLSQNPTESARQDLYEFLEANNVPITQDGCFVTYKKVRDDWWDSHTGHTHENKPGSVVSMPREAVDNDRRNTCSAGLHVAAFEYAQGFSGTRLLECKVNPRDVVAVPPDYSQQKMRVCRYEVLRETTEKYTEVAFDSDNTSSLVDCQVEETLHVDKEGRLRIPGRFIRAIGVGVGGQVEVVLECIDDEHLLVRPLSDDDVENWVVLSVDKDNSVRLSPSTLSLAYLNDTVSASIDWFNNEAFITLI